MIPNRNIADIAIVLKLSLLDFVGKVDIISILTKLFEVHRARLFV